MQTHVQLNLNSFDGSFYHVLSKVTRGFKSYLLIDSIGMKALHWAHIGGTRYVLPAVGTGALQPCSCHCHVIFEWELQAFGTQ